MAVAVDASSPALATNAGATTTTTAAFSPPASSIIVAALTYDNSINTAQSRSMSNSGTALTWNTIAQQTNNANGGYAGLFWAYNANAQTNITVTETSGTGFKGAMKVYVLTGADTTTPVIASNSSTWSGTQATALSLTNGTRADGMYVGAAIDWNQTGAPTSADLSPIYTTNVAGSVSTGTGTRAATVASTTYSGTFTFGNSTAKGQQVGAIIQPSAGGGSTFSGSVSLSGSGTLSSTGTPALTRPTALAGAGSLTSTGTPKASGSVALSGGGALTFTGGIGSGLAFTGGGSLALVGAPTLAGSVALGGSGSLGLTAAVVPVMPVRLIFRTPYVQRRMPISPPLSALINFSVAVLRINGQWVETEYPTEDQLNAADLYFPGGHENPVDQATADILTAAGYTVDSIAVDLTALADFAIVGLSTVS